MNHASRAILALAVAAGVAHANPTADAALAEGRRLYDLQEWDKAIAKFKEAYTLREDAPALFNIAQAYRLKGDCASAVGFYKTFKRKFPKERNIAQVDKFIVEMEACAKAAKTEPPKTEPPKTEPPKTEPPKTEPPKTEPPATEPGPPPPDSEVLGREHRPPSEPVDTGGGGGRNGLRIASYVTLGVGAAGVVVGGLFGMRARAAAKDAEALDEDDTWMPAIQERGLRNQRAAIASFAIGGAAIAGGVVMFLLSRPSREERNSVSIVPTTEGASVVWGGRF